MASRTWGGVIAFETVWATARERAVVGEDRCGLLYRLARQVGVWGGEIWECGVYRGGSALVLAAAANGRPVRLFDTFHGLPPVDPAVDLHREGDFGDTSLAEVAAFFQEWPNVMLYPGCIPETFADLDECRIGLLHLDVDLYASVKAGLTGCYPRMQPWGIMVIDDYQAPSCPGTTRAVDEFFADKPETPIPLALGPALVLRAGMESWRRQVLSLIHDEG